MTDNVIKIRRSSEPGRVPSSLHDGELALNLADELLYARNAAGAIVPINDFAQADTSLEALVDTDTTTAPPQAGDALVWDGTKWVPGDVGDATIRKNFTATEGQTVFTVDYEPGSDTDLWYNGIKLNPLDYTATDGAQFVLSDSASAGDFLQFMAGYNVPTNTPATGIANVDVVHVTLTAAGESVFTVQHDVDKVEVWLNGLKLFPGDDYISDAPNNRITLVDGGQVGDKFQATGFFA